MYFFNVKRYRLKFNQVKFYNNFNFNNKNFRFQDLNE